MRRIGEKYFTTREIARYLHLNEKKIYMLASNGEIPSVRISGKWLFPRTLVEKYLREKTHYPAEGILEKLLPEIFIIEGSDDFLFKEIIYSAGKLSDYPVSFGVLGSVGGLDLMLKHKVHAATVHFIVDEKEADMPALAEDFCLVNLFTRQQGLMFKKRRTGAVRSIADVIQKNMKLAVREKNCGTYHLTRHIFSGEGFNFEAYKRKTEPYLTHLEAARAVVSAKADVAVGIRRVADLLSLDFQSVIDEEYYLMLPFRFMGEKKVVLFIDALLESIRRTPGNMREGYLLDNTGRIKMMGGREIRKERKKPKNYSKRKSNSRIKQRKN